MIKKHYKFNGGGVVVDYIAGMMDAYEKSNRARHDSKENRPPINPINNPKN